MANVQVTLNQTLYSEDMFNVMNWQTPDTSSNTLQSLANGIAATIQARILDSLATDWALNSISMRVFDGAPPFTTEFLPSTGILNGTGLTSALPPTNALLVALSYTGPRPNRGRQYYGGLTEGAWDGQVWNPVTLTDMEDMWSDFITGVTTASGLCFPRIARVDYVANTWTLDSPVEQAIARSKPSLVPGRNG